MKQIQQKLLSSSFCILLAACGGGGGDDNGSGTTGTGSVPSSSESGSSGSSGSSGGTGSAGNSSSPGTPNDGSSATPTTPTSPAIASQWTVSEIPAIAAGRPGTIHLDINDSGTILGTYWESVSSGARVTYGVGTISAGGNITNLGTLNAESAYGEAINNSGQFVGHRADNTAEIEVADRGPYRAFIHSNGTASELPLPADAGIDLETTANRAMNLNDAGAVVGYSTFNAGSASARDRAYVFANGARTEISPPAGAAETRGLAINDSGQVVGEADYSSGITRAFSYISGAATDLGTLPGFSNSSAVAINKSGQIVGTAYDKPSFLRENMQPFIYSVGSMRAVPLPDTNTWGEAVAINDLGQVAGTLYAKEPEPRRIGGFLHSGGRTIDLNTLAEVRAAGITVLGVESINAAGQIIVYVGMNPTPKHYLLTPVR